MDDFWEANKFSLDEIGQNEGYTDISGQVNDTCSRINHSVNNTGANRPKKVAVNIDEMVFVGAILFTKFCLWFLYRYAQQNDMDVSGL